MPLTHTGQTLNIDAVYAKLEYMNPYGLLQGPGQRRTGLRIEGDGGAKGR